MIERSHRRDCGCSVVAPNERNRRTDDEESPGNNANQELVIKSDIFRLFAGPAAAHIREHAGIGGVRVFGFTHVRTPRRVHQKRCAGHEQRNRRGVIALDRCWCKQEPSKPHRLKHRPAEPLPFHNQRHPSSIQKAHGTRSMGFPPPTAPIPKPFRSATIQTHRS